MTVTAPELDAAEAEAPELPADETTGEDSGEPKADDKTNKDRDFTKFRPLHEELAAFVNANEHFKAAKLEQLSPGQVKAVLYLRADYNDSPEKEAERERKRLAKAEEDAKYEGLNADQIKAVKAAQRKADSANKMAERAAAAQKEADELIAKARAANGGEPVAAKVEAAQSEAEPAKKRPGIKR